jgi:hypothetical protein
MLYVADNRIFLGQDMVSPFCKYSKVLRIEISANLDRISQSDQLVQRAPELHSMLRQLELKMTRKLELKMLLA